VEDQGVLNLSQKNKVINLYIQGKRNSEIARIVGLSRPTVIKYVNEYKKNQAILETTIIEEEKEKIIIQTSKKPTYNSENRKRRKLIPEIEDLIIQCLEENAVKMQNGNRKLIMKNTDIHELVISNGFDISYRSICQFISDFNGKSKETYIRQSYHPGECVEFDWGEVSLNIKELGGDCRLKIGVFASKHSDYRWASLYLNENTESFIDIHVTYFNYIKGVPKEVVYDNALVNVQRLAGKEKKPSNAVHQLSQYYGYSPRYTNDYSGNEKGHVERSVELIRRKAFCTQQCFDTVADAELALTQALEKINSKQKQRSEKSADAVFAEEQKYFLPYKIPMDRGQIIVSKVDKYGFIYIDCNYYSVPDYLNGKRVVVKKYAYYLRVYFNDKFLFETKRIVGRNQYQIDINHYLKTLKKKPGAIAHSLALKQANPWLQSTFNKYYNTNPRGFITFLELINVYSIEVVKQAVNHLEFIGLPVEYSYLKDFLLRLENPIPNPSLSSDCSSIHEACQKQLLEISSLYQQGDNQWIN
jgi:Transposase and inactivated derivatives